MHARADTPHPHATHAHAHAQGNAHAAPINVLYCCAQDSFDETDFIEKLTRKQVFIQQQQQQQQQDGSNNSSNIEFVSDSFMKIFVSSLETIQKLKEKVDKKIETLQEETKEQENKHKAKLGQLQERFDQHFRHFKDIDKRVSRVGSAAATIGNRLQTLDNHRERALQCKELFDTFLHLNNIFTTNPATGATTTNEPIANKLFADPPRLLKLFLEYEIDMKKYRIQKNNMQKVTHAGKQGHSHTSHNNNYYGTSAGGSSKAFQSRSYEEIYQKVLLCKQLYNMSQELDVDRLQTAKRAISIITKELENKILQDFEKALYDNNYQTMKVIHTMHLSPVCLSVIYLFPSPFSRYPPCRSDYSYVWIGVRNYFVWVQWWCGVMYWYAILLLLLLLRFSIVVPCYCWSMNEWMSEWMHMQLAYAVIFVITCIIIYFSFCACLCVYSYIY